MLGGTAEGSSYSRGPSHISQAHTDSQQVCLSGKPDSTVFKAAGCPPPPYAYAAYMKCRTHKPHLAFEPH